MSKVGVHLIIEGRVQGVGFRYFCQKVGVNNNITGYVRNLIDGNVEIVAEGEIQNINQFIKTIKNDHPFARVLNIKKEEKTSFENFTDFSITY